MTRLAGNLPGGDANGLVAIARQLIDNPHEIHVAVVLLDCKSSKVDHDSGEIVPTARIRRVEVIGDQDRDLAQKMMRRAETRTGKTCSPSTWRRTCAPPSGTSTRTRGDLGRLAPPPTGHKRTSRL